MNILWLTPYPPNKYFEYNKQSHSLQTHTCSWIIGLEELVKNEEKINLNILTLSYDIPETQNFQQGKINYYFLKRKTPIKTNLMTRYRKEIKEIQNMIYYIQPDVIQAFGTEDVYALACLDFSHKSIVHIQGIITLYNKARGALFDRQWLAWTLQSIHEKKAVSLHKNFFIRTKWDSSFVLKHNPRANLYNCWEALRSEFYQQNIFRENKKKYLLFLGGSYDFKGYKDVLEVFFSVYQKIPDLEFVIGGNTNADHERQIFRKKFPIEFVDRIKFPGILSAKEIIQYFSESLALIVLSKMENSPNSICEAQICGVPVISVDIGGISDLIENNETGFLIEYGDRNTPVNIIERLFNDSSLFNTISRNARETAKKRHNPVLIKNTILEVYNLLSSKDNPDRSI